MVKTVFITGANRGIGKATLEKFAQNGWNAVAHARKPSPEFIALLNKHESEYGISVTPIYFDMRDADEMKQAVKETVSAPKLTIDALINNAGVMNTKLFLMFPMVEVRDVFEVNLFAQMRLTQLILKRMPKHEGSIVNIASVSGINMREGQSAYGVSKAALLAWTKVLSLEFLGKIRVNAIAPGQTDTDMGSVSEIATKTWMDAVGRLASPEDVANAAYWLTSDEAKFINGSTLTVDGGVML